MKRWNELARSSIEQAGCIIVLLVFVIISVASGNRERNTNAAISGDINEGWIDEDGQAVDLYDLEPGDHSVTLDIRGLDTEGKAICFKTVDTNFRVYASDELIYEYNPAIPRHLGLSYGMQYHTIAIPEGSSTLRMDLDPVFANTSAGIRDIAISVAEQYMTYVFKRNLFPFGQCTTTIVIGLLFVIAGITGQIVMKSSGIDFISLGMICVMVGFVGINDTLILQILTGRPELIRVIEYMCFVFLPFPALSFFSSTTGDSHSKLSSGMFVACLLNFILQVGLTRSGISDYYYLVYISQVIIAAGLLMAVVLVYRAVRHGKMKHTLLRSLTWGLFACVLGVGIDMFRYHFFSSYGDLTFTRIGVLLFTIFMGGYLYKDHIDSLKQKQQESIILASEISQAFAKVIDMKDKYTNGHSERVAKYTAMIAKEMGYDAETVEKYYRIGLLHDVGKVGVPKSVLNKPGKLPVQKIVNTQYIHIVILKVNYNKRYPI